jgi:hypothetical protein
LKACHETSPMLAPDITDCASAVTAVWNGVYLCEIV